MFFELYHNAHNYASSHAKHLIIVGGTGFYLKAMMEGLSLRPTLSLHVKAEVQRQLLNLEASYALMQEHDPHYAQKVASNDTYRIEKWLEIFIATKQTPSLYLAQEKQAPLLEDIPLFEIDTPKDILAQRVIQRTQGMMKQGLIEEVFGLEKRYTRTPQCMKAIGIKEVLDYFDGLYSKKLLEEKISTHTLQLAKRQRTFNTSQFKEHPKKTLSELKPLIETSLKEF